MTSSGFRSRTLVAALAALPIVVSAAVLIALETARGLHPRSDLFAQPAATSLAEALDGGDLVQAHALLARESGVLLWVSHPALTGGTSILVSPLLWAAGTGNDDAVRMLLGMGHDMSSGTDRYAACLARAAGKTQIATRPGIPKPWPLCSGNCQMRKRSATVPSRSLKRPSTMPSRPETNTRRVPASTMSPGGMNRSW